MAFHKEITKCKVVQIVLTYIGTVLYIVCFATPAWIVYSVDTQSRSSGLFRMCIDDSDCTGLLEKDGKFTAAQVLGCLGLVSYVCFSLTASLALIQSSYFKQIKIAAFISSLSAGTFIAIALLLVLQSDISLSSALGYSGIIGVITVFIALILCPFHTFDRKQIQNRKGKRDDKKPLHCNIAPIATRFEGDIVYPSNAREAWSPEPDPFQNDKHKVESSEACSQEPIPFKHVRIEPEARAAWSPVPSIFELDSHKHEDLYQEEETESQIKLTPVQSSLLYPIKRENTVSDIHLEDCFMDDLKLDQPDIISIKSDETAEKNKPAGLLPLKPQQSIYFKNANFIKEDDEIDEFDLNILTNDNFNQQQPAHVEIDQHDKHKSIDTETAPRPKLDKLEELPKENVKKSSSASQEISEGKEADETEKHPSKSLLPPQTKTIMYSEMADNGDDDLDFDIDQLCKDLDDF